MMLSKKLLSLLLLTTQVYISCMEIELYSPFSKIPEEITEYITHKTDNIRDVNTFSQTNKEHYKLCNTNKILLQNERLCSSLSPIQHTLLLVKSAQMNDTVMVQQIINTENLDNKKMRNSILKHFAYNNETLIGKPIDLTAYDTLRLESCITAYKGLINKKKKIYEYNILDAVTCQELYPMLILIKNNGNINTIAHGKKTPLIMATLKKNQPIIKLLLTYNCQQNIQDQIGNTALHHACELKETKEIVQLLLNHQCNPNLQNNKGDTPLHIAIRRKNFDLAELLIKHNADTTIKNKCNKTALELTGKKNGEKLIAYIPTNKRKRAENDTSKAENTNKKRKQ